jgi:hypothetical protein
MATAPAQPDGWNPRPPPELTAPQRVDYHAGYSDAFHRYSFGAACAERPSLTYVDGFRDGETDRA